MTRNLKITLAYDGSEFHGWQIQPGLRTVQGTLADSLKRLTGEDVLPQGSGRTDAGVHALAQVASVKLESPIPEHNLVIALNDVLPPSIRVNSAEVVPESFHARHSAKAKTYRYRIYRGDICPPFLARYVYHDPYPMNEDAVIRSSDHIVGKHDFTSFAASDPDRAARIVEAAVGVETSGAPFCHPERSAAESRACPELAEGNLLSFTPFGQRGTAEADASSRFGNVTNVRTIHSSQWTRTREELVYTVRGDGFLHHMVRNLVGTFLLVGKGSLQVGDVPTILEARNRSAAGPTAAACGLYLVSVEY
jgi:tRNA pseudouridine38-40 synthase